MVQKVYIIVTKTKDEWQTIKEQLPENGDVVYKHRDMNPNSIRGMSFNALYFVMDRNDVPFEFIEAVFPVAHSNGAKMIFDSVFDIDKLQLS